MATRKILAHQNYNQNEIQNAVIQNLSAAPNNPKAGQIYYHTGDKKYYGYDGTNWIDLSSQGAIYSEGAGIDITSNTISIDLATGANAGNVTLTTTNGLAANAPTASTSTAGLIEIATDTEVSTGTDTSKAVTPKQLAGKVNKLSTAPTAGTYTKVTINSDGLVTSGGSLQASDIPNLTLSKITDVTASASELNILDGVTVTTNDINSITTKISLTDLSIDSGSTNYLTYDNSNGKFGANVDTTVTASSTNLVTSGAVSSAIGNALSGALIYEGTWTATGQTDYSSITLPVKKGYMYAVSGNATIGGVEWYAGDYLVINKDIASGGTITSADVDKIDNTEASDIVRLASTQTLTNKTIDADDNTIQDLTTTNFKSGVIQTTVRAVSSASDSAIATEKAVATAINGIAKKITVNNPSLTASGGQVTWTITNSLGTDDVVITIKEVSSGEEVYAEVIYGTGTITVKMNSSSNVAADTYKAVIIG